MVFLAWYNDAVAGEEWELTMESDGNLRLKRLHPAGAGQLIDLFGPDEFCGDEVRITAAGVVLLNSNSGPVKTTRPVVTVGGGPAPVEKIETIRRRLVQEAQKPKKKTWFRMFRIAKFLP